MPCRCQAELAGDVLASASLDDHGLRQLGTQPPGQPRRRRPGSCVDPQDESFAAGAAGASRGGLTAAAGTGGRRGHQCSVAAPTPAPIANPASTSDG